MLCRKTTVALVLTLVCAAFSCRRSKGGVPADAFVERDGGTAAVVAGRRRGVLPAGDLAGDGPVTLVQDESGRRLAYRTASGMARILYLVGDGFFVGPLVPHPPDFGAVPDLDHALGPLFEAAGERQNELVREVRAEHGEQGVVRLLLAAAYVDSPVWEGAFKDLSPTSKAVVREELATALDPGQPSALLRRGLTALDLRAPENAKKLAARARERASGADDPQLAADLLRAVIANDPTEAAAIGCEVLAKRPASPPPDHVRLVETATLAIAAAGADCPDPKLLEAVLEEPCAPAFLCNDEGQPLWIAITVLTEPLCTREQIAKEISRELELGPSSSWLEYRDRASLYALAALMAKDRVPAWFSAGHARRFYAIQQPTGPACDDSRAAPGAPCRCDEFDLRFAACKKPGSSRITHRGCRFQVDDAKKRIFGVVADPEGAH